MASNDFLSIRDFSPEEIRYLLDLATEIKTHPAAHHGALKGKTLALIFEKPSLRTRVSFDVGIQQLGGFSLYLSSAEINLGKRESLHDVAKNLERMVQAIMIRTYAHEIVEKMAEYASIPIINGLTDYSHPCQAMADYLTMLEIKGHVRGLKVAYIGDGNNVCHSLIFTGAQLGAHVWAATPPGYEPKPDAVRWATERGQQTGASLHSDQRSGGSRNGCGHHLHRRLGQHGARVRGRRAAHDFQSVSGELGLVAPCQVRRHLHALSPSASWP